MSRGGALHHTHTHAHKLESHQKIALTVLLESCNSLQTQLWQSSASRYTVGTALKDVVLVHVEGCLLYVFAGELLRSIVQSALE